MLNNVFNPGDPQTPLYVKTLRSWPFYLYSARKIGLEKSSEIYFPSRWCLPHF